MGPWHLKQCASKIGRTSDAKSGAAAAQAGISKSATSVTSRLRNASAGRPDGGGGEFTGCSGWHPVASGRQPLLAVKTDGERGGDFEILVFMGESAEEVMV